MKFTTIQLTHKRSEIILEAKVKYELFNSNLDDFVIKNNIFRIDEGTKLYDFIGDQGPLKFISENFKNLLEDNNITGLKYYPIIIEGENLKYYYYTTEQNNSIYEKDEDGDRIYGTFQVDIESWNGADIFYLKDSGATVCTLRVKEIIEKAKITNIDFEDLSNY